MAKTEIIYRATLDSSGVVKGVNLAKQNLDSLGASAENTAKKLGSTSNSAGVAGATLAEVGRLVSDLPYGFSAVANNASQLVSMFGMLTISAGGLGKGLKELGKAFLGPVGIVVAVQAAIAYYEEFVASSNKAKDATNSLTTELEAQALALSSILKTFTIEQYDDTLKLLVNTSTEFKNAFDKLDETQKNNKDTVFNLMSQYKELLDIRRQIKAFETALQRDDLPEQKRTEYLGKINGLRLKEIDLLKIFRKESTGSGKEQQELIEGTVDYYEYHIKQLTQERDAVARSAKEIDNYNKKIKALEDALNILLFARRQNKVENLLQILGIADIDKEEVADQIAANVPTPEEIAEALKAKMAGEESAAFLQKFLGLQESAEKTIEIANQIADGLSIIGDFFDGEAERDIAREKNKTTKVNNELRQRLKNENLSAAQKERINKRIAANEYNLDKRLDKIREKQFKQQKAFKIAIALADTASMAAKAYLSQLSVPTPDAIIRAKAAAKIAAAFGLLQVATIARQKYVAGQTSISGLGGGTSTEGGGEPSTPDFNVVGASQLNQVAAAVAGQQERPIRTYVVASDVSTAQELDRNILSEASIG
jgi:hypothetical protein